MLWQRNRIETARNWHRCCPTFDMFMKNAISGISGFLDLALVPLRSAAVMRGLCRRALKEGQVMLLPNEDSGQVKGDLVFQGDPLACPQRAESLMADGGRVMTEGIPLEEIAVLCSRHNYRWRFHPDQKQRLRVVLEPARLASTTP